MLPLGMLTKNLKKSRSGFAVVLVITMLGSLLFLSSYFLEQSTSEIKIAKSENAATKGYYLAESGINEAIFKLKYDATWRGKFLNGTLAGDNFNRSSVFDTKGAYTVSASSIADGLADITVTATYQVGSKNSQRVIKARLAKASNPAYSWSQTFFGGGVGGQQNGNITTGRDCTINGGRIHANQNLKITSHSDLTINDAEVTSSNNIITNAGSSLVLNNSTQTEGLPSIGMPIVDFDSSSLTSLKNRASQVYTAAQFSALPSGTTLNGITFVTGTATWTNKNLTVNGVLAASGNINISLNSGKIFTVNTDASGSGILGKADIGISLTGATLNLNGLIYTANALDIDINSTSTFNITGGIIGWHVDLDGTDNGVCSVTYDEDLVATPLDPVYNSGDSPIIDVNHWEEQY